MFEFIKSLLKRIKPQITRSYRQINKVLYYGYDRYKVIFVDEYDNGSVRKNESNIFFKYESDAVLYAENFVKCDSIEHIYYSTLDEIVVYPKNYEVLKNVGYFSYDPDQDFILFRPFCEDYDRTYFTGSSAMQNFVNCDYIETIKRCSRLNEPLSQPIYTIETNIVKIDNHINDLESNNKELKELKQCLQEYNKITEASRKLIDRLNIT